MQKGGQKVETTGSTRFHSTLWKKIKKIGTDRTS